MTKEERIELLKCMHKAIMNIDDETAYMHWIVLGVPDEPQENDFDYIAEDDESFIECVKLFCNLVRDFL